MDFLVLYIVEFLFFYFIVFPFIRAVFNIATKNNPTTIVEKCPPHSYIYGADGHLVCSKPNCKWRPQ